MMRLGKEKLAKRITYGSSLFFSSSLLCVCVCVFSVMQTADITLFFFFFFCFFDTNSRIGEERKGGSVVSERILVRFFFLFVLAGGFAWRVTLPPSSLLPRLFLSCPSVHGRRRGLFLCLARGDGREGMLGEMLGEGREGPTVLCIRLSEGGDNAAWRGRG